MSNLITTHMFRFYCDPHVQKAEVEGLFGPVFKNCFMFSKTKKTYLVPRSKQ